MRQVICVLLLVSVSMCFPAPQAPTFFFTSPNVLSLSPPALPQPAQPQFQAAPAAAAPAPAQNPVFTATQFQAQDGLGQFRFGFANTDGQVKTEFRSADTVVGMYRYISPEGIPIQMSYVADKNGFQAIPAQAGQLQAGAPAAAAATATGPVVPPELAQAHAEANLRLAQAYRDAEVRLAAAKQKAAAEALANAIAGQQAGAQAAAEGGQAGGAPAAGAQPQAQQPQQQIVGFPISLFPTFG